MNGWERRAWIWVLGLNYADVVTSINTRCFLFLYFFGDFFSFSFFFFWNSAQTHIPAEKDLKLRFSNHLHLHLLLVLWFCVVDILCYHFAPFATSSNPFIWSAAAPIK